MNLYKWDVEVFVNTPTRNGVRKIVRVNAMDKKEAYNKACIKEGTRQIGTCKLVVR